MDRGWTIFSLVMLFVAVPRIVSTEEVTKPVSLQLMPATEEGIAALETLMVEEIMPAYQQDQYLMRTRQGDYARGSSNGSYINSPVIRMVVKDGGWEKSFKRFQVWQFVGAKAYKVYGDYPSLATWYAFNGTSHMRMRWNLMILAAWTWRNGRLCNSDEIDCKIFGPSPLLPGVMFPKTLGGKAVRYGKRHTLRHYRPWYEKQSAKSLSKALSELNRVRNLLKDESYRNGLKAAENGGGAE